MQIKNDDYQHNIKPRRIWPQSVMILVRVIILITIEIIVSVNT